MEILNFQRRYHASPTMLIKCHCGLEFSVALSRDVVNCARCRSSALGADLQRQSLQAIPSPPHDTKNGSQR